MLDLNSNKMNLQSFFESCKELLKEDQVVEKGSEQLREVSLDTIHTSLPPVGAIYPENADQVSLVVKLAAEHDVSLWVYSTALNWGYGNTVVNEGEVLLILSRMNSVLHVDEELAYAVIEPGVSYQQLNEYLVDQQIALWTDCIGGPPTASVIGNAMERGFGATPYYDHFANLCGMEIVLADGSIVKTGNYANTNPDHGTWHTFQRSAGPVLDGIFSQSNFGIVVRAGIWLMPKPETIQVGAVRLADSKTLPDAIDSFRQMLLNREISGPGRFSNDMASLTLLTQARNESIADLECLSEDEREQLRKRYGLAEWNFTFGLFGSKAAVRTAQKQSSRYMKAYGKPQFFGQALAERLSQWVQPLLDQPDSKAHRVFQWLALKAIGSSLESLALTEVILKVHQGLPSENIVKRAYFHSKKTPPDKSVNVPRDDIGLMWFVPLLPFRGKEVELYIKLVEELFATHRFTPSLTISSINERTVVLLTAVIYNQADSDSCQRAENLYSELQTAALERGYQQYRCGRPGWDRLASINPGLAALNQRLKKAVDPKGTISPGKYGI